MRFFTPRSSPSQVDGDVGCTLGSSRHRHFSIYAITDNVNLQQQGGVMTP
ncbi:succinyldiaminopimelate aminotransferase, partial [Vibrio vulnificus]